MLILLPPSEGKTPPRRGRSLDLGTLSFPELTPLRESVVETVARVSGEPDAAAVLEVNPNLVADIEGNTRLQTAPTATASHVYTGVLYQALDVDSLDAASKRRANRWIVVVSALFGALRLGDRVPAYRVNICSTLPGVGYLSHEWRKELPAALDAVVKPRELVVDCRSSTYAAVWRPHGRARRALGARHRPRRLAHGQAHAWPRDARARAGRGAAHAPGPRRAAVGALRGRADAPATAGTTVAAGRDAEAVT